MNAPAPFERPAWSDPRWPFAAILTAYGVLGFGWLGFNRTWEQMALIVVTGSALDVALCWWLRRKLVFPLSAYITSCSLALLLNYSHHSALLFLPALLAIGSKHLLTFAGRHVYNPSMFGVATSLLFTGELITAAPAYQWAGGSVTMSAFVLMMALVLFVFRIQRTALVLSFLAFYAVQTGVRAWYLRHHLPPEMLFVGTLASPPFFIFVFYMLTDPATSPKTPRGQVIFSLVFAAIDLYLHKLESVYTFFYTALIMATGKLLWLHGRALRKEGLGAYLEARLSLPQLRVWATCGVLAAAGLVVWGARPAHGPSLPRPFALEPVAAAASGISAEPGRVLDEVDPRLAHISKWLLSVGDAAATGDYDGDGKLDLFLTLPLKRGADRAALYRNLGDLRFARVALPALGDFAEDGREAHARAGLPSGATFVDYDGDGDQDLALAVGFGHSRLLRNQLRERGVPEFSDVSAEVGLAEYTTSLAINFLDVDRDAKLDMFVTNSMTTVLPEYSPPAPLNVFALPAPAYEGDRRMFRFMHNGWHDADNGGGNNLYLARGDGTFARQDAAAWGLGETRWSLAVATADYDRDGFTDMYVANDFGPDRLYLNRGGSRFESIVGPSFADVGRDTYKGMNASVADFDRNGWLDVYVSNVHHSLQAEGSLLWMFGPPLPGETVPHIVDEATQRNALNERRFGWGAAAGDLDLDGWPDIVQANGMVDDRLDRRYGDRDRKDFWYVNHKLMQSGPAIHTYADMWGDLRGRTIYPNEARRVYRNLGGQGVAAFADVAAVLGVDDPDNSRGVVLADFDDDGDLDFVITNQHGEPSIYRSRLRDQDPAHAHFVGLQLLGNGQDTHVSAIGTRVELSYEHEGVREEQVQEVTLLGGFHGQKDPRLHFGLGDYDGPVQARIHWYGGPSQTVSLAADRYHTVSQPVTLGVR